MLVAVARAPGSAPRGAELQTHTRIACGSETNVEGARPGSRQKMGGDPREISLRRESNPRGLIHRLDVVVEMA